MKALPVGVQSFADLRKKDYLYVDKTKEVHQLITSGKLYFLSRPRRFGKSLLASTLEELFKGNKPLFEGLYIYDKYDWTRQYPVLMIDWSNIKHSSAEAIEIDTCRFLAGIAASYQITLLSEYASGKFAELIERLYEKTGCQVVVLVDEYDMPILDALENTAELAPMRAFLQEFYRVLKGVDKYLQFVFLTGVSKFAKVSLFSGMNSPDDITMDETYAAICGYTQEELEACFADYIHEFACKMKVTDKIIIESVRRWYNGYSWDGVTTVYNPFSTLLLFRKKVFSNHWFSTGSATFLVNQIKKRNDAELLLEPVQVSADGFDNFELDAISTKLLLFQTGYLTVKSASRAEDEEELEYTLGIPNEEVRKSLIQHVVSSYTECPVSDTGDFRNRMRRQLSDGDVSGFQRNMRAQFARIPYQLHIPCDAYYHSLILLWLNMLGFEVLGEVPTSIGRIDAVWKWKDRIVIAEIKHDEKSAPEALVQEAFDQIHKRRYYDGFAGSNRRIALMAIAIAGRDIECRMEEWET